MGRNGYRQAFAAEKIARAVGPYWCRAVEHAYHIGRPLRRCRCTDPLPAGRGSFRRYREKLHQAWSILEPTTTVRLPPVAATVPRASTLAQGVALRRPWRSRPKTYNASRNRVKNFEAVSACVLCKKTSAKTCSKTVAASTRQGNFRPALRYHRKRCLRNHAISSPLGRAILVFWHHSSR